MDSKPSAAKALLQWVNTFALSQTVSSLDQLSDGTLLWAVCSRIDPDYFANEPQPVSGSDNWLAKWQNLKQVNKATTSFIRDVCKQSLNLNNGLAPDLKAIATSSSDQDATKLLKIILMAAIGSPKTNEQNIAKIASLSIPTQASIKAIIEEMQSASEDAATPVSPTSPGGNGENSMPVIDLELHFEERLGKIMAEKDNLARDNKLLQKDLTSLQKRLEHLQQNNDILQKRLTDAEDALKSPRQDPEKRELWNRVQRQSDTISAQESKLVASEEKVENLQQTVTSLRSSYGSLQQLRDELDEVKVERDDLEKKANMAERFRQKLEASKEIEKEVNVLRENLDEANEHLKELDAIKKQCAGLQLANAEYRKNLPMLEQDIHELQKIKRSLEFEKSTLAQKFDRVNEQLVKDQDLLAEQQDRIRELEADHVPFVQANGNLDSELASSEEDSSALKLENNNLKAEIKKLSEQSTSPEKFLLEQLLEDAKTKTEIFERKYLEVHSEKLVLEASLNELRQEDPTGSARTFLSLREKLQNAKEEAAKTSKELNDAKTELSNVKRQLLTAQTDLSLVDKDRLEVLEGVKKANSSQTEELSNEIEQFQRRYKDLESDLDVQKTLLNAALLGKGALQEELSNRLTKESDRASAEIKAGIELLKAAAEGQEGSQGALEDHIGKMMSKLIEYRERISKRSEHIKKQNEIIMSLEKQVENAQKSAAESSSTDSSAQEVCSIRRAFLEYIRIGREANKVHKAALREEMRNIQRENSLIATAWYDLTSRLQTNSVVVQRRNDAPKSWLNKQRQLLTASSASVHRR